MKLTFLFYLAGLATAIDKVRSLISSLADFQYHSSYKSE